MHDHLSYAFKSGIITSPLLQSPKTCVLLCTGRGGMTKTWSIVQNLGGDSTHPFSCKSLGPSLPQKAVLSCWTGGELMGVPASTSLGVRQWLKLSSYAVPGLTICHRSLPLMWLDISSCNCFYCSGEGWKHHVLHATSWTILSLSPVPKE